MFSFVLQVHVCDSENSVLMNECKDGEGPKLEEPGGGGRFQEDVDLNSKGGNRLQYWDRN